MANEIHRSKVGTYHPAPEPLDIHSHDCEIAKGQPGKDCALCNYVAWTIHDSRGTIDGGSACDECQTCECFCPFCGTTNSDKVHGVQGFCCQEQESNNPDHECIGLSFSFVCLDGGETLCEECAAKAGITITDCDCA